jgi:hypothetical protein
MSASNGNDDLGPRLEDDGRALAVPGFDPHIERGVEALLAVGNGYLGADPGVTYRCERLVALRTSRDAQEPRAGAARHAGSLGALGPGRLAQEHRRRWAEPWRAGVVELQGDDTTLAALGVAHRPGVPAGPSGGVPADMNDKDLREPAFDRHDPQGGSWRDLVAGEHQCERARRRPPRCRAAA